MRIEISVPVAAPKPVVWRLVTDIDGAAERITGIEQIEILERPAQGLQGLKWKETRTLFGKSATETMWVTEVDEGSSYVAEASSHGAEYRTKVYVAADGGGSKVGMVFECRPLTLGAKVAWAVMGFMMKGVTRKALLKDLEDIKRAAEAATLGSSVT